MPVLVNLVRYSHLVISTVIVSLLRRAETTWSVELRKVMCPQLASSPHFVEPGYLLPCLQEPVTSACTVLHPVDVIPACLRSILILSYLGLYFQSGYFPPVFPTKPVCAFLLFPMHTHAPPIKQNRYFFLGTSCSFVNQNMQLTKILRFQVLY
jgi:hypothetical protein